MNFTFRIMVQKDSCEIDDNYEIDTEEWKMLSSGNQAGITELLVSLKSIQITCAREIRFTEKEPK